MTKKGTHSDERAPFFQYFKYLLFFNCGLRCSQTMLYIKDLLIQCKHAINSFSISYLFFLFIYLTLCTQRYFSNDTKIYNL